MAASQITPPPGFELEQAGGKIKPPPGFTLDSEKPKEDPGFLDKEIPLTSHTNATLSGVQSIGRGVRTAVRGIGSLLAPPETKGEQAALVLGPPGVLLLRMGKSLLETGRQATEVPGAIHDINQSPDPLGHYAKAAQDTAGEGAGQALTALATEGIYRGIPKVTEAASGLEVSPKIKAVGKLAAQDAASHIPVVGRLARRPSIGDYISAARTPKAPPPVYPGANLPAMPPPEVLNPSLVSPARTLPGMHSPEVIAPPQALPAAPIPSRSGLLLKGEVAPPPATSPKAVGDLLNKAVGAEPLKPNVPLKNQLRGVNAQPPDTLPAGHEPVESSAIKSFKYSPETREFEAVTKDGRHYIHGDISPEQAEAFSQAESKGKAWQDIRKNGTLVAKVINGKRISAVTTNARSATPTDEAPSPRVPAANENLSRLGRQSLEMLKKRRSIK